MEFNESSPIEYHIREANKLLQTTLDIKPETDAEVGERKRLLERVNAETNTLNELAEKNVQMLVPVEMRALQVRQHGDSGIGSITGAFLSSGTVRDSQLLHQRSSETEGVLGIEGGQGTETKPQESTTTVAETSDVKRTGTCGRSNTQGLSEKTHGQNITTSMIREQPIAQASVIDKDNGMLLIGGTGGSIASLKQLAQDKVQETRRQKNNDKDELVLCEEQLKDSLQKVIENIPGLLAKAKQLNTDIGDAKTKILKAIQSCHKSVHDLENLPKAFGQAYRDKQKACSELQEICDAFKGLNDMIQDETPIHVRSEISAITADIHSWIQNMGRILRTGIPIKTECLAERQ